MSDMEMDVDFSGSQEAAPNPMMDDFDFEELERTRDSDISETYNVSSDEEEDDEDDKAKDCEECVRKFVEGLPSANPRNFNQWVPPTTSGNGGTQSPAPIVVRRRIPDSAVKHALEAQVIAAQATCGHVRTRKVKRKKNADQNEDSCGVGGSGVEHKRPRTDPNGF